MNKKDLPARWKKILAAQFPQGVEIQHFTTLGVGVVIDFFGDVLFHCRNAIVIKEEKEVLVLTEHCGYYIFPTKNISTYSISKDSPHER